MDIEVHDFIWSSWYHHFTYPKQHETLENDPHNKRINFRGSEHQILYIPKRSTITSTIYSDRDSLVDDLVKDEGWLQDVRDNHC